MNGHDGKTCQLIENEGAWTHFLTNAEDRAMVSAEVSSGIGVARKRHARIVCALFAAAHFTARVA